MNDPLGNHQHITTRDLRDHLGRRVDAAHYAGETTIVTKNGEARAVLISVAQYRQAMEALADPTTEETK